MAKEERWRLWLRDGLLHRFGLTPVSTATAPGSPRLQQLKQAILTDELDAALLQSDGQ